MGTNDPDLDRLPPEARFAVRALAAGFAPDEIAGILRVDGPTARKHLRTVVRATGGEPPPPSCGDDALRAALAPALALAAAPPRRVPGTACLPAGIAADLARGRLDGPLLLATAEHAADCPACMRALATARSAGQGGAPGGAPGCGEEPGASASGRALPADRRGIDLPLVAGALTGLAAAAWYLFLS